MSVGTQARSAVGMRLAETVVVADAGGVGHLAVTVRNDGTVVDQLRVEVLGAAAPWSQVAPAVVGLFPGEEAVVAILFSPPRTPGLLLEEVPFGVKVVSGVDGASAVEEGVVQIGAFRDVSSELRPRTVAGRRRAGFELVVENRGNRPATLAVHAEEPEALLEFDLPAQVEVGPGEVQAVPLKVVAEKRRWTGKEQARPFSVHTQADDEPTAVSGTFVHKPMLSRRAWMALAALLALLLLWFAVLRPVVRSTALRQAELAIADSKDDASSGPEGPAGPAGPEGVAGAEGPAGPGGPAGAKGLDGAAGAAGSAGAAGDKGADGAPGERGAQGTSGAPGATGAAGAAGAAGRDGSRGADGQAGARGGAGAVGPAGAQGPAGPQGPAGLNGASAAFSDHRAFGPTNAPSGPQFTTIITQTLDPGLYFVMAKTVLITSTSTGSDCTLTFDGGAGEVELDRTNAPMVADASARSTHNLQRLVRVDAAPATIRLSCRTGTTWGASDSDITAIQLQDGLERDATPPPPPTSTDCGASGLPGDVPHVVVPCLS